MQRYWIPSGTPQTRCPLPDVEEANKPKGKKNKIAITFINLDTSSLRNNMNPSKGTQFQPLHGPNIYIFGCLLQSLCLPILQLLI